jgi:hypothetical protein
MRLAEAASARRSSRTIGSSTGGRPTFPRRLQEREGPMAQRSEDAGAFAKSITVSQRDGQRRRMLVRSGSNVRKSGSMTPTARLASPSPALRVRHALAAPRRGGSGGGPPLRQSTCRLHMNAQRLSTADGTDEIAHAQMTTSYEAKESANDRFKWDHVEHRTVTRTPLAGC